MTLNPFEMLGETIQSISRVSREIEKMKEQKAARFFDVEYAADSTDQTVDTMFGLRDTGDASAAVIGLANNQLETTPTPQQNETEVNGPLAEVIDMNALRQEHELQTLETTARQAIDRIHDRAA